MLPLPFLVLKGDSTNFAYLWWLWDRITAGSRPRCPTLLCSETPFVALTWNDPHWWEYPLVPEPSFSPDTNATREHDVGELALPASRDLDVIGRPH